MKETKHSGAPMSTRALILLAALIGIAAALAYTRLSRYHHAQSLDAGVVTFTDLGTRYTGYVHDTATHSLRLETNHPESTALLSLEDARALIPDFVFATNGGIFASPNTPAGLTISEGRPRAELNLSSGEGNFFLEPNGVFAVGEDGRARVVESHAFSRMRGTWETSTQSGPMLVEGGRLHPAFRQGSTNRRVRSGVGVRPDGAVVFAVSHDPVTFWEFATLFRDGLGCPNALYLDGTISGYALPGEEPSTLSGYASLLIAAPR